MVSQIVAESSRMTFAVAYNGPSRPDEHSIDVETLGPALVAIGRLVKEANVEFNGKATATKVVVSSDFENRCFYIQLDAIVTVLEHANALFQSDGAKTAKEVLEWIGFLNGAKEALNFFDFLRRKRGRKAVIEESSQPSGKDNSVNVWIEGDGNTVTVQKNVFNLSTNPKALAAARDTLTPIGQNGFETFELRQGVQPPFYVPVICGFTKMVSGTGGRMPRA